MFCWHKQNASGRTAHTGLFSGNCTSDDGSVLLASREEEDPQAPPDDDSCVDWADDVAGKFTSNPLLRLIHIDIF